MHFLCCRGRGFYGLIKIDGEIALSLSWARAWPVNRAPVDRGFAPSGARTDGLHGKKDGIVEARQPASQLAISPEKCGPRALGMHAHSNPLWKRRN